MKPVILMLSTMFFSEGVQARARRNDKSTNNFKVKQEAYKHKKSVYCMFSTTGHSGKD